MELRSCSHLHFIQTVAGGKMMNVFRGKPALKFKELKDIYETGEAGNHHFLPAARPKLELEDWSIDSDRAETESLHVLAGATIKIECESPESNCSSVVDGGKTESDDVNFGTMTLKQFKERYKSKKRKLSRNTGLIGQTSETCSPAKQEPHDSQFELEEFEAMEPLSSWKSRILKSRKKKRTCRSESSFSSSSESALCIVKSKREKSDQVIFQSSGILPAPIDVKVEVMEPISFDCRYVTLINSSGGCGEPLASSLVVSSGEPEIADGCVLETGTLIVSVEEPETANDGGPQMPVFSSDEPQCCVVNDQSYEGGGHVNPESILDVNASCGEILTVDIAEAISVLSSDLSLSEIKEEDSVVDSHPSVDPAGVVSPIKRDSSIAYNDSQSEELERVEDHGFETHKSTFFCNELQCCAVNEESYEPVEHADPKSMPDVRASGGEIRMVDVAELTTNHKPERVEDHGFETHKSTFFSNDPQCCVVNEESFEPVEHAVFKSMPDIRASGEEIIMVDVAELTTDHTPGRVEDHGFETHKSTFFSNDPQCCVVNEESFEPVEHAVLKSMPDIRASGEEIIMVDVAELATDHTPGRVEDHGFETHKSTFFSNELQCCAVNEESYEPVEHADPKSMPDVRASGGEIRMVDVAELTTNHKPERVEDHGFETHKSTFFSNDPQCCAVNEESFEPVEHAVLKSMPDIRASGEEIIMVDVAELATDHTPGRVEDHGFETHKSTFFSNDLQCCVVNKESYEPVEHAILKSMPDIRASGREIIMVDVAELTTDHNSCLSSADLKKESSAAYPHPQHCGDDSIEVASPSNHHASDMGNDSQNLHGMHELPESKSYSQVPDTSMVNISHSTELSNRHGLHLSEDEAKDERPHVEASVISSPVSGFISFRDSNLCSGQDGCLASAAAKEKKAPLSACADAARKFSAVTCVDEPVTLANVQGRHHSKLQHLPEKLLSTRKAISPTSQKKLCKAMEASDLDDEEYYKYTRKLCYRNLNGNKIGRLGRANQNQRVDLTISPERITRKPKNDKNVFRHKGILKVPHPSGTVPRFGTGCSSVQSCSESAISFSQKQMRDIESIATKLTKELNSMKDVVQESWHSKVYPATPLKYSADEVKIAVQNATRVEESARRWLSIMARDCNRFCKIMKLTDKASATSGNVVPKEKRKIVFADEAGGKLCEVKTFENDTASVTESSSDK